MVTKEKEFSTFQNSEIGGLKSSPEWWFQPQGELYPHCWPLFPPQAKTKGAPLFLGRPGHVSLAESTTNSHNHPETKPSEMKDRGRDQSFREACLPVNLQSSSSACCAQLGGGLGPAICGWLREEFHLSGSRELWKESKGQPEERPHSWAGMLWQRQNLHWKPQGMKWHVKRFLPTKL